MPRSPFVDKGPSVPSLFSMVLLEGLHLLIYFHSGELSFGRIRKQRS